RQRIAASRGAARSSGAWGPIVGRRAEGERRAATPMRRRDRDTLRTLLSHMKRAENSVLFKYSRWDAIPVLAALAQFAYLIALFLAFPRLPWWALIPLGLIWSVSISWNINGISHNFLHNAYFKSAALNRAFSALESVTVGFSQVFYEQVHKDHHKGNADLPDANGRTRDPLSIYKHGH